MALFTLTIIGINVIQAEDDLVEAESDLATAFEMKTIKKIKAAVTQIASFNNEKAIRILINKLSRVVPDDYECYWGVISGFVAFTDAKALEALTDFIISNKSKAIGKDVLFSLKTNHSPEIVKLLSKILQKSVRDQQVLALDHLSILKSKLAVKALIDFLQQPVCKKDKDLYDRAVTSIHALVGNSVGQTVETLNKWWSEHQNDDVTTLFPETTKAITGTGTAVDDMDYVRINRFDRLKMLPKDKIIVVVADCKDGCEKSGRLTPEIVYDRHNFDHIEKILAKMGIPHTAVKKSEFDTEAYNLDERIAILFNCNMSSEHCACPTCRVDPAKASGARRGSCTGCDKHIRYSNKLSDKAIEKIKNFVVNGGYIFTEDWELTEVLEPAFNVVSAGQYLDEKYVTIFPGPGSTTHPYLRGVFERPATKKEGDKENVNTAPQTWKIDASSPAIKISNSKDVTVLIISPELKENDKDSGVVAVTFGYSRSGVVAPVTGGDNELDALKKKVGGQVLHVLSHFGKQLNATDEFTLQNLILNYLMEAADRYSIKGKK